MNNRRFAAAGIGILAAASLALTACDSGTTTGSPPASGSPSAAAPNADAAATLTAALAKLGSAGWDVTVNEGNGQTTGTGSFDPAAKSVTAEEKGVIDGQSIDITVTQIDANLWAKVDLGALGTQFGVDPTKWMSIDETKLTSATSKFFDISGTDPFDLGGLLSSVGDLSATDSTHVSGTVDLTKATGVSVPGSSDLTSAGPAASKVPFTVTLDDQGRPVDIKISATGAGQDLAEEFAFSNFGSPTAITAPDPADVVPAPDAVYRIFNG